MKRFDIGLSVMASLFFGYSVFAFTQDPWLAYGVFCGSFGCALAGAVLVEIASPERDDA